ncbi:zinc ribbon domain-containing protein [uncultured Enorma sp.]|uniref:zinc ribbon domain-containing protein n=1 Tax=uncultured Enorma sp. TaxID=1714346 RepID=UPI0025D7903C|nr:zinc-ribbon domain-containing protein [uncultured Enorma sp.]
MNHCTSCGAPLKPGAKFCEQCGAAAAEAKSAGGHRVTVDPDIANDIIVWEGKEYTAQEWADRFGGKTTGAAAAESSETERDAAHASHTSPAANAANAARAAARSLSPSTPADIEPYTSSLTDEERTAGNTPSKTMSEHARKKLQNEISNLNNLVRSRSKLVRSHMAKVKLEDETAAKNVQSRIDAMEHDSTYFSETVAFNDLTRVNAYRSFAEKHLATDAETSATVFAWLNENEQPFLDDAEILATRMWETFDEAALDRANDEYRDALAARDQAAQELRKLKADCDAEIDRLSRERVALDYSRPISDSIRHYALLCLALVVLTLALSLINYLILHAAFLVTALPIVRIIGLVGAIGFFVAGIFLQRGPERKRAAEAVTKSEACERAVADKKKEFGSLIEQAERKHKAAQERADAAALEIKRAEKTVDPTMQERFSTLTYGFVNKLDALDKSIDVVYANLNESCPLENFEQSIDAEWMDELKKHDAQRYMMLHTERSNEAQTSEVKKTSEAQREEAAKQTRLQEEQTRLQEERTRIAQADLEENRRRRKEASQLDRQRALDARRAADAAERASRAQEDAARASEQANYSADAAERAREKYYNYRKY